MLVKGPFHLGLVGWPLGHSLSPQIHKAALHSLGLEGEYALFLVPPDPEKKDRLTSLVEKLRSGDLHGLNVTIPYKIDILAHVDILSPAAEAVGAANTLFFKNQKIIGDNTDVAGFLADLSDLFPQLFTAECEKKALLLGSGGAARAVAFSLLQIGWQVIVASRSIERGHHLAGRLNQAGRAGAVHVIPLDAKALAAFTQKHDVSLIVNTTPVGMEPDNQRSPWPSEIPLPVNAALYDLVYSPPETRLVKSARRAGLQAYTGLGMLVEQAACSFEIWTGRKPSRAYLMEELKRKAGSE